MKRFFLVVVLLTISQITTAQIRNINPDPNGEPWIVGGLRVPTQEELDRIPVVELPESYLRNSHLVLPAVHDNSTEPYFRPVFNQTDGCCAQASGIGYNFTYEINRARGTAANISGNRYPTHYTYNFLNSGSGDNGSWYQDGWDIVKANGCPTEQAYGGMATGGPKRWMSGNNLYENAMDNRVKENFAIDVSTEAGLNTLKHWLYDHLEGASSGSLVNFAAGAGSIGYNMTGDNIVVSWGAIPDHAMTFIGWDDTIEYDYNHDGQITNNIDTNNDGVVDLKDWERGALIMVNSWGDSWGFQGKAYVMYKILAEDLLHGGIVGNKVFGIRVKQHQTPQLKMRVRMTHNKRNKISIKAGIAADVTATAPEHILEFPLFNKQGGAFRMAGINSNPVDLSLDVSPLLTYVQPNTSFKFFLVIDEDDPQGTGMGTINEFSIVDNNNQVYTCTSQNVQVANDGRTLLAITTSVNFDKPEITTNSLPAASANTAYSYTLQAQNGTPAYEWSLIKNIYENTTNNTFPNITSNSIVVSNDDDGFGTQMIDFDFPFMGTTYNQFNISTDGSIIFENEFSYIRSETAIKSNKTISVFASDLNLFTADGDGIFYEGDANHATFRWKTSLYGDQAANIDVAVTLYPDGKIKFFYGNGITPDLDWAAGVSDGEGSNHILSVSGQSNPSNQAFEITFDPFPKGMYISNNGVFQGTAPNEINTWTINFKVTDNNYVSAVKPLNFEVTTTGIQDLNISGLNCYPNPVTDYTTISYSLNENTDIDLSVYDLSGKLVEHLLNKNQKKGNYQLIWKPALSSGVYIYKLTTSKGSKSGKIIIK